MELYGGSFVKKLGELILLADEDNLKRIRTAWPEYWEKYQELGRKLGRNA
jgi:hypothetical protein